MTFLSVRKIRKHPMILTAVNQGRANGESIHTLAKRLHTAPQTIRKMLRLSRTPIKSIPFKRPVLELDEHSRDHDIVRRHLRNESLASIAKVHGLSNAGVWKILEKHDTRTNKRLSRSELLIRARKVKALHLEGKSIGVIQKLLGLKSRALVYQDLKRMGVVHSKRQ